MSTSRFLLFLVALLTSLRAAEIKVATLNCLLLSDPRINHPGKIKEQEQMTLEQYNQKLAKELQFIVSALNSLWADKQVTGCRDVFSTDGLAELGCHVCRTRRRKSQYGRPESVPVRVTADHVHARRDTNYTMARSPIVAVAPGEILKSEHQ